MNTPINAREEPEIAVADGRPRDRRLMPSGLPVLTPSWSHRPSGPGSSREQRSMSKLADMPPMIVVIAPAGYGKSTAIAQWAATDERPSAWLSLDARDNDPYVLLNYIHVAVDTVAPLPDDVTAAIASAGSIDLDIGGASSRRRARRDRTRQPDPRRLRSSSPTRMRPTPSSTSPTTSRRARNWSSWGGPQGGCPCHA